MFHIYKQETDKKENCAKFASHIVPSDYKLTQFRSFHTFWHLEKGEMFLLL